MDLAVVYMVAGISSRFGRIKQLERVGPNGEMLIEYSMGQALKAGFNKIVLIVGERTEKEIRGFVGEEFRGVEVYYVKQNYDTRFRDKPWGTADALASASSILNWPFVVCNGDDIYGEEVFEDLAKHLIVEEDCATIGYRFVDVLPEKGEGNRGLYDLSGNYVAKIKEGLGISKENLSSKGLSGQDFCSMNIFALRPQAARMIRDSVRRFKAEKTGDRKAECYIQEEISKLIESQKIKMKIYPARGRWFGITYPGDELLVKKALKESN